MKTLHTYLTGPKTSPLLYCELTNLNVYHNVDRDDYLFFFLGTAGATAKQSNSYKWRKYYENLGKYTIVGEFKISRRAVPPGLSYKKYSHAATAVVLVLRKEM